MTALHRKLMRELWQMRGQVASIALVEVGHRNGEQAEVVAGLAPTERVIAYPSGTLAEGAAVVGK